MHSTEGRGVFCEKSNVWIPISEAVQEQASCVGWGPQSLRKVQWVRTHQYGISAAYAPYHAHHITSPSCNLFCSCIHLIKRGNYAICKCKSSLEVKVTTVTSCSLGSNRMLTVYHEIFCTESSNTGSILVKKTADQSLLYLCEDKFI